MQIEIQTNRPALRVHLSNVAGFGASQLLQSLLPKLEENQNATIVEICLPDHGPLSHYQKCASTKAIVCYRRYLPNALSRILECMVFARKWNGTPSILVLGDLPLRCKARQTVFVQTTHILKPHKFEWNTSGFKYLVSRTIFQLNAKYVSHFIVQTGLMRDGLAKSYPDIANRIHVLAQPVPSWLLDTPSGLLKPTLGSLRLVYPAACYPHKNHKLLSNIKPDDAKNWPISSLKITLAPSQNPAPFVPWIECLGFLPSEKMVSVYQNVDGLLFLSTAESYGFPLIEAMYMGLPIVCPDLPYAHALCADNAIYFDPLSIDSLHHAITVLDTKLSTGWRPDWSQQLRQIPKSWEDVAASMLKIACTI